MLNIKALLSRGYRLVQTGAIDFELVKNDKIIVYFEIESSKNSLEMYMNFY